MTPSATTRAMRTAIVIFPGSNCDRDLEIALHRAVGRPPVRIWHAESELPPGTDLVAVPGGFSFGDYLRSGAIAARSPAMRAVREFAARGGLVLGLCNGFQILAEIDLLPGAFLRNASLKFICRDIWLRVESTDSPSPAATSRRRSCASRSRMPTVPTPCRQTGCTPSPKRAGSPSAMSPPRREPETMPPTRMARSGISPGFSLPTGACSG